MGQGTRLNGSNPPYAEAELQAAKEAMEAVMGRDADAVDEVVGSLRAELRAMDAEYNELLASIQETQQQQQERQPLQQHQQQPQQQARSAAGEAQRSRGGYGDGSGRGGGGGIGGDVHGRTVSGGGGGGGWDDGDGVVVTGDRGIDGGDVFGGGGGGGIGGNAYGQTFSGGGGGGGGGLDPAQLAEAAQRAAWLMERMEAKGAQILQLTTLAGHAATQ